MFYYEVFVAEAGYQKNEALTYASELALKAGSFVIVPYGKKKAAGFVDKKVPEPEFKTKEIIEHIGGKVLPKALRELYRWVTSYYPGNGGAAAQLFVPSGLEVKSRLKDTAAAKTFEGSLPPLTSQQESVISDIERSDRKSYLLHGETGSGKTRVYQERALCALNKGKSVIVLTPEISLVPQLASSFEGIGEVVIMHSGLTKAKRNKNWLHILHSDKPLIVVGTRSALFSPLDNVGFIALDEMHEPSYKQEQAPRYHALRAAAKLAQLHGAEIIYGSATPPVVEYYIASQTKTPILSMTETARPSKAVTRTIVDLKDVKLFNKHRYISDQLAKAIGDRLQKKEQSLLFLNRRGTARLILCQVCGWQALCPRCDTPLTYHGDNHTMRCHTCGFHDSPPYSCPECGSDDIVYRSLGTKALVDALQHLFPEALIKRFDTDNLVADQLDKHFGDIVKGKVDILVGTQMLGKGLDLPKLSLVGIINADTGLSMPDYSSAERSYQLLHQAIGRVGRGHVNGEVIVQTFNPDSPLLRAAVEQDWQKMYAQEIAERKQFNFPPFCFLLKISVSRKTDSTAEQYTRKLRAEVAAMKLPLNISESSPAFYERSHGKYNWQLVIKARERKFLVEVASRLPKGDYAYELDPINLL